MIERGTRHQRSNTTDRMTYSLRYSVLADSRLQAIEKATLMVRTGIKVRGVVWAEQGIPGWWDVVLSVWEDG